MIKKIDPATEQVCREEYRKYLASYGVWIMWGMIAALLLVVWILWENNYRQDAAIESLWTNIKEMRYWIAKC